MDKWILMVGYEREVPEWEVGCVGVFDNEVEAKAAFKNRRGWGHYKILLKIDGVRLTVVAEHWKE